MRFVFIWIYLSSLVLATDLTTKISNMIMIGFKGTHIQSEAALSKFIKKYSLGGVIIFGSNLKTPQQARALTNALQSLHKDTLLIALDQEGGYVDRLSKIDAYYHYPSAAYVSKLSEQEIIHIYHRMSYVCHSLGFNLNLAPCVDLAINKENKVIVKFQRSYGSDPKKVVYFAQKFIDAFTDNGVLCTLKHFPGHGSSKEDSHKGFTDVTQTWKEIELLPFAALIQKNKVDVIMSAHIFNKHLDSQYPATLSYKTLTLLLRKQLGYDGVIISDDLQMGAIEDHYSLKERIKLSINAGVDVLLFGNQIGTPISVLEIVSIIKQLLQEGEITLGKIENANRRINRIKAKVND